ncbi:hypothetical protein GCM10010156_66260 [Planobispora rosea]|uniref:Uncharacterized protein n=1 Tax=Planobispora rosea TaxID=35762 RepID=A0A8J3S763_PLARO|nr:hypothetical protein [Planobispora rosea]GGS98879.1 hypothetical protein GCM10010156_66260 [Planobispora rosea]GIH87990.1 hypothetical protein Pro02_63980 [Planobispora rosea]
MITRREFLTGGLFSEQVPTATAQREPALLRLVTRWELYRDELEAVADRLGVPRPAGPAWDAVLGPPS